MPFDPTLFKKNLTYNITASIPEILVDLEKIAKLDRWADQQQRESLHLLIGFIIGAVASLVLTVLIPPLGLFVLMICIPAAIFFGIKLNQYARLNIANYRYQLAKQVVQLVSRDMDDQATIALRLICSKPDIKSKQIHSGKHPSRSGWTVTVFQDTWLTVQGSFLDETNFLLTSTEMYQTQSGRKRGRSGKIKLKTKSKSKGLEFSLMLTGLKRRYGAVSILNQEAIAAIKLPNQVQLKRLKISEKSIHLVTKTPAWVTDNQISDLYKTVTAMFLSLYQILNLARLLSKQKDA